MNKILPLLCLPFFIACKKESSTGSGSNPPATTDSFTVTVNNGYGSGKYKTGDTVHIFSIAYTASQLFDTWSSSDAALLNGKNEWHTWLIMPARNLSFSGSLKNITPVTLAYEQIRGRDRLKPVYYFFPAGHKGFVLLLHGSGGTAQHFVSSYEYQQLIKDLVNDNFGVIVTEAEEATTGIDANGEGKLRWGTTPYDSVTNIDYANIKIITDTFYNRGITNRSKLRFSAGMSNGGNFSSYLSALFKYKAGVSYCAPQAPRLLYLQPYRSSFAWPVLITTKMWVRPAMPTPWKILKPSAAAASAVNIICRNILRYTLNASPGKAISRSPNPCAFQ